MKQNKWEKLLNQFKAIEQPEAVLLISNNKELAEIVVAWKNTPIIRKHRLSRLSDNNTDEQWNWLWENSKYSFEDLKMRIPSNGKDLKKKFDALVANKIIYPDGSINSFVEKYLRAKIISLFPKTKRNKVMI